MSKTRCDKLATGDLNTSTLNDRSHHIKTADIDDAMKEISHELKLVTYQRSFIECCCCESHHSRFLGKKDVFIKDGSLFELTPEGYMIEKEYGRYKEWKRKYPIEKKYAYLEKK